MGDQREGSIPINVDGGLLSKGHPIGATGGSQIRTIVQQLRGEAGDIQVKDPEIGLVHNIGGVGLYGNEDHCQSASQWPAKLCFPKAIDEWGFSIYSLYLIRDVTPERD